MLEMLSQIYFIFSCTFFLLKILTCSYKHLKIQSAELVKFPHNSLPKRVHYKRQESQEQHDGTLLMYVFLFLSCEVRHSRMSFVLHKNVSEEAYKTQRQTALSCK